jgi:hypothetical protein
MDSSMKKKANITIKGVERAAKTYGRRIVWHEGSAMRILQIYNKGLEFALVSDKFKQCHPFIWCKDFLHDVVYSTLHERKFEIYRFKYDPSYDPKVCLRETRLLVTNAKDAKIEKKIDQCLEFLNQIEENLLMPCSKVRKCSNAPAEYKYGVFLFQGSKRWMQSPPMISLYSLLIRVGFSHVSGTNFSTTIKMLKEGHLKPYQNKDSKWLNEIEPALYKIMRFNDRKIFHRDIKLNYPKNFQIEKIHNNLGIMSFANDMRLKVVGRDVSVPYWHRFK